MSDIGMRMQRVEDIECVMVNTDSKVMYRI